MSNQGYLLGEVEGFGRVHDCGDCGNIHVTIGPVSLTLTPEAFMQLVTLMHTSAANFEVWVQRRHAEKDNYRWRDVHADSGTDGNKS
jgi:hypothetical protein